MSRSLLTVLCLALPVAVFGRQVSRIVGGTAAADGAWPWQLSLRYLGSHSCGASLIGSRYAACAAHCVGNAIGGYMLIAGTNQRSCPNSQCVEIRPEAYTRHPDYVGAGAVGYPNDVSVLTWLGDVSEVVGSVEYVPMADGSINWEGTECYITGWGRLSGNGILPENLQEAVIDVISIPECQDMWSDTQVHDFHVCVYDVATQARGACNGDSGGPLVCRASSSSPWELVGATSWGRTGCDTAWPSVYTRISYYKDWIEAQNPAKL